jgi:cysteinyl-tRNA synthetase
MRFFSDIRRDYRAVFEKDPAAKSALEVIVTYPGFHAILIHRLAHALWESKIPFIPRFMSFLSRLCTGIDIHPGAKIGPGFFIDHGLGVVIGETSEIGEDCLLYQGVTLGGTGKEKGKRHPTLGKGVVVGAGAKVLGPIRIGDYVKIGANSVVLHPVPDTSIVVGVPGRVVKRKVLRIFEEGPREVLDHVHLPDPYEDRFRALEEKLDALERKLERRGPILGEKEASLKIYNTLSARKEDFIPVEPGKVKMYVCGVTVYDVSHIGHARSAIVFDAIRRYLKYRGFDLTFVKNFTDIDDKIINKANKDGIPWQEVVRKYTGKYYEDMHRLGVDDADIEPRATGHIPEIIEIIQGLVAKGNAYVVDGDVYYSVQSFPEYGKLSKRNLEDMMAGARVEVDERKRNPMDFALWKSSKPGEPSWDSPWGLGRPGWHIECSAMSMKYLGQILDIHAGGADLIFPHHENEIAQSEAYTGKKPFARYWIHNGFITVDKEKMSKSLGNFFTIEEILDKFDPETVRLFLLQTHYRSPIEFSDEPLKEAEHSLERYYLTIERVEDFLKEGLTNSRTQTAPKPVPQAFETAVSEFKGKFLEAMDDDFNTALAIGHMFELIKELNRFLDSKPAGVVAQEAAKKALALLKETGHVLNIFIKTPREWLLSLLRIKHLDVSEEEIERLMAERQSARKEKNFARADEIRKELDRKGIVLEDKKDRTEWRVKL